MAVCTCKCCDSARRVAAQKSAFHALTAQYLDADLSLYQTFDNGLHAWGAYKQARVNRWPIPEWVLHYFDEVYAELREKGGTATPKRIAQALRLHTARGGDPARERAVYQRKYLAVISAVRVSRLRLSRDGRPRKKIDDLVFADVSGKFGLSPKRIRDIYYEWAARPVKPRTSALQRNAAKKRPPKRIPSTQ